MICFTRVHKKGGGSGAGKGRRDFAGDMAGFANARDDQPPRCAQNPLDQRHEIGRHVVGELIDRVGL